MAFNLFPKSPAKGKPDKTKAGTDLAPRHDARQPLVRGPASAREIAAAVKGRPAPGRTAAAEAAAEPRDRDITVTGPHSMIEWSPADPQSILVVEANPVCAPCSRTLRCFTPTAKRNRPATCSSAALLTMTTPRCRRSHGWRCSICCNAPMIGLHSIELALQYVVAFERSAPGWEEGGSRLRPGARPAAGGYVGFTGKLTASHAAQIANLLAATQRQPQVRMDLGSLTGADDAGAKLLADALAQLRKRQYSLILQHPEKIRRALDQSVKQGRNAGEGYWILLLELMQWQNDHKTFEDCAIEFAIAFEVSPPSWEPPLAVTTPAAPVADSPDAAELPENAETLVWSGTLTGSSDAQLAKFALFREKRNVIPIDMTAVDRIDFVCAGALLNGISRAESQRKSVQIVGASPIVRALLLLIGISPRHFIKKAQ